VLHGRWPGPLPPWPSKPIAPSWAAWREARADWRWGRTVAWRQERGRCRLLARRSAAASVWGNEHCPRMLGATGTYHAAQAARVAILRTCSCGINHPRADYACRLTACFLRYLRIS
jgi:hypothetical protein